MKASKNFIISHERTQKLANMAIVHDPGKVVLLKLWTVAFVRLFIHKSMMVFRANKGEKKGDCPQLRPNFVRESPKAMDNV
jgi:hypothetical protein